MSTFIVICQQIVGGNGSPFVTDYSWDGRQFTSRPAAIRHGFKMGRSDDFNVGEVKRGKLVGFFWMDKPLDVSLNEIGEAIYLTPPASP